MDDTEVCSVCNQEAKWLQMGKCMDCRDKAMKHPKVFTGGKDKQYNGKGDSKPNPDAICRYFLEGNCKYGNSCKYTHAIILSKPP